jgi:hypothetical protein
VGGERSRRSHGLVEPYDGDLGSARVDRDEWTTTAGPHDVRTGGHPELAATQARDKPLEEMVGTAGPGPGEPGDEHGSAGQDVGSMDSAGA